MAKNLRNLMDIVKEFIQIPELDIHLCGSWLRYEGTAPFTADNQTRYDHALLPFCILRRVPKVTIHTHGASSRDLSVIKAVERAMQRLRPLGDNSGSADDPWSDKALMDSLDVWFIDLEFYLDRLKGKSGDMMRLERFISWYVKLPDVFHNRPGSTGHVNRLIICSLAL